MASQGQGLSVENGRWGGAPGTANLSFQWWTDFNGQESVVLSGNQMPGHYHAIGDHNHALARALPNYVGGKSTSSGPYTLSDVSSGVTWTEGGGGGATGWAGNNEGALQHRPRFYLYFLIKL